jgi:formylglycine-generating enzyme required for sulfatase activity
MLRQIALCAVLLSTVLWTGCGKKDINMAGPVNRKTGVKYKELAGDKHFTKSRLNYKGQPTGPGLVFIEGGTFHMGGGEKDIAYMMDNRERQVTVASFYIDETEVSNIDWWTFLVAIGYKAPDASGGGGGAPVGGSGGQQGGGSFEKGKASIKGNPEDYIPDTTVWRRDLAYNEPYVENYFQHPAFYEYPVVGINWYQANDYCRWRTGVVNGKIEEGYSKKPDEAIMLPRYRLPTEAEWEYAARGLLEQELYPWEGKSLRYTKKGKTQGDFRANFKRGRGDYAGRSNKGGSRLAKGLNDAYMITAPVRAFAPNDFGLYNMAGNVAEWTLDTYRVLAFEDVDDLNPYRRRGKIGPGSDSGYETTTTVDLVGGGGGFDQTQPDGGATDAGGTRGGYGDQSGAYDDKTSLALNKYAKKPAYPDTVRFDYFQPDPLNKDGSPVFPEAPDDRIKVYRGGSWADLAYYLTCGSRRFLHADSAKSTIGFRCAMTRLGKPY